MNHGTAKSSSQHQRAWAAAAGQSQVNTQQVASHTLHAILI